MKVLVLNKQVFEDSVSKYGLTNDNVSEDKIHCFICVFDSVPRNENDIPYFNETSNVKILRFDDVEEDSSIPLLGTNEKYQAKSFTSEQADELLKFLDNNRDKEKCIVHCSAGFSRSGAIGLFINDYFGGNWFDFKKTNPHIQPNATVLRKLKAAFVNKYSDDI